MKEGHRPQSLSLVLRPLEMHSLVHCLTNHVPRHSYHHRHAVLQAVTSRRPAPKLSCPLVHHPSWIVGQIIMTGTNSCTPYNPFQTHQLLSFIELHSLDLAISFRIPISPRPSLAADQRNEERGSHTHIHNTPQHCTARARSASDQRPCKCKWTSRMTASSSSLGTTI